MVLTCSRGFPALCVLNPFREGLPRWRATATGVVTGTEQWGGARPSVTQLRSLLVRLAVDLPSTPDLVNAILLHGATA
ncbi:hypothetical protein Scel_53280 [Streptomyces cellostaticus]|nr:hypothetical protein Scel_53280 [Streptomyces cellostaticus]